ncbi:Protein of unknown function [Gryllus bimaculatus]|nr:Protein of unknown function [Gryllus bimaculatus]
MLTQSPSLSSRSKLVFEEYQYILVILCDILCYEGNINNYPQKSEDELHALTEQNSEDLRHENLNKENENDDLPRKGTKNSEDSH